VLGLGEGGTHAVIDAHLGGILVDERELARPLLAADSLHDPSTDV
jgi:hypothetical protein